MTLPLKCPTCDSEIPEGTPGGLCPVCLLAGGGDTTLDDQTISADGSRLSGKEPDTVETPASSISESMSGATAASDTILCSSIMAPTTDSPLF